MKTRSSLEICLPLVVFVAACTLSIPTLVIAAFWMTIGVVSLGHRALENFPRDGICREWFRGGRAACLWFYSGRAGWTAIPRHCRRMRTSSTSCSAKARRSASGSW
jgi:hypothetical protein